MRDYETLSEDEGDNHDEGKDKPTDPSDPTNPNEEGLKDMDDFVVKVRESVIYIKGSQGRKKKFRECIEQVALSRSKEFDALDRDLNPVEKTELEKYLEEKRSNRSLDIDILEYWNLNQFIFPHLALMARDILSIPISIVASESAFSTGGRILDQYRSCLAHVVVESLIYTQDWRFNKKEVLPHYSLEELTQDVIPSGLTMRFTEGGLNVNLKTFSSFEQFVRLSV
ncbi:hypothetical protein AgCh_011986 [Apium graveolens]